MSIDSSHPMAEGPRPEWDLPEVRNIEIRRIPFEPRRPRNFESTLADYREAAEFLVRTSGRIPARALGPALFVGNVRVVESEQLEDDLYRFLAFDVDRLEPGAPIRWGWIDATEEVRQETGFRYEESR